MRFDADCRVSDLIRTVPHIAFEVDDLDKELKGKELLRLRYRQHARHVRSDLDSAQYPALSARR
jgi:hypothetical protein